VVAREILFLSIHFLILSTPVFAVASLAEQFKQVGYVEFCDTQQGAAAYDALYASFDEFIAFLKTHPVWARKLYNAKERFICSKEQQYYSTDLFGLCDESGQGVRKQIAFRYSIHFHEFICAHYPEFNEVPEIIRFFEACREIQKPYGDLFAKAAVELGLEKIFSSQYGHVPILLKVVKYLSSYSGAKMPHYDISALSLLLDSTDNQSLLLSPYKASLTVDDFYSPHREFSRSCDQNSIVLIPGMFLTEFGIYPTPHIVVQSDEVRYATIAFAKRPHYITKKTELSLLPSFKD
jgi:hypothetical protein